MGDGSVMRFASESRSEESDSEEELCSEEQEASLLLLSLRLRDFDLPLPRLLLVDLRLDDPRDEEEDPRLEALDPTDKSFLVVMDAGDLGGR